MHYESFLSGDTRLPMIYMSDAIRGIIELMESSAEKIKIRSSYNISGFSFTPKEIRNEIINHIPEFKLKYLLDFRQEIADSWPETIDDSFASKDWGWKPKYNLKNTTTEMLINLKERYNIIA